MRLGNFVGGWGAVRGGGALVLVAGGGGGYCFFFFRFPMSKKPKFQKNRAELKKRLDCSNW